MSTSNTTSTTTVKPDEHHYVKLHDNPTTGYTWEYVCDDPEATTEVSRESVRNGNLMGSPSTLTITFKSTKSNKIKLYHVRKWENKKLEDLEPNHVHDVVVEQ